MRTARRFGAALLGTTMLASLVWAGASTQALAADAATAQYIKINEIESNGDATDWVELLNTSATQTLDIGGLGIKDDNDSRTYQIPAGTTLAPGAFFVVDVDALPGGEDFGLGSADMVRLFNGDDLIDSFSWTGGHAATTYGRCPSGLGDFVVTASSTKGAANDCIVPAGVIVINEIESQGVDWIEFKNIGNADIDLQGYVVRDNAVDHAHTIPTSTIVGPGEYWTLEIGSIPDAEGGFGLGGADSVRLYKPGGLELVDSYTWTTHASQTYGRCGDGVGGFVDTVAPTRDAANDCPMPPVVVNEIVTDIDGTPDSIELFNNGDVEVDLSGYILKDNNDSRNQPLAAGTTIAAKGFLVLQDGTHFDFGLGNGDQARLFLPDGVTLVDGHTFASHGAPSWGRCPDGTGEFVQTNGVSLGSANGCGDFTPPPTSPPPTSPPPTQPALPAWPGGQDAVELPLEFQGDSSGLEFQWDGTGGILWAIDNGTGTLFKLNVTADGQATVADGWQDGKRIRFIRDAGDASKAGPDAEGVTVGPDGFVYIASERDNSAKQVNQNTILKVDPSKAGPDVVADQEWDITATLPAVEFNAGIEAVEYIADADLSGKFWDTSLNKAYDPADYPGHGDGLFFVAVEENGTVYAFALNDDGTHALVGQFHPGMAGVMALDWDPVLNVLWAVCDNGCDNASAQITFDGSAQPVLTAAAVRLFAKPDGLPVENFEGFATGTAEMCANGVRPVWWFEDGKGVGALRTGTLPCGDPSTPVTTPPVTTPPVTTPAPSPSVPGTTDAPSSDPSDDSDDGAAGDDAGNPVKPPALPNTGSTNSAVGVWALVGLAGVGVAAVARRHRQ